MATTLTRQLYNLWSEVNFFVIDEFIFNCFVVLVISVFKIFLHLQKYISSCCLIMFYFFGCARSLLLHAGFL